MKQLLLFALLLLSFSACKQQTTVYYKYSVILCDEPQDSCTGVSIYKSELSPDDFEAQLQKKYPRYTIHGKFIMYKHTE